MFSALCGSKIVKQKIATVEYSATSILDIVFLRDYYMLSDNIGKYNIYRTEDNKLLSSYKMGDTVTRGQNNTFYMQIARHRSNAYHVQPNGKLALEYLNEYVPLWVDNDTGTCLTFNGFGSNHYGFKLSKKSVTTQLIPEGIVWTPGTSMLSGTNSKTDQVFSYDCESERVEFVTKVKLPVGTHLPNVFDKSRHILLLATDLWDVRHMSSPLKSFSYPLHMFHGHVIFYGKDNNVYSLPVTQLNDNPQVVFTGENYIFGTDNIEVFSKDVNNIFHRETYCIR